MSELTQSKLSISISNLLFWGNYPCKYCLSRVLGLCRYFQAVVKAFKYYSLQSFRFASSVCCSIAFSHLGNKTASQQLFYRGLRRALTLSFLSLYRGCILQGPKWRHIQFLTYHDTNTRSIEKYQLYLCILWKALMSWNGSCATEQHLYPTTTLNFCNTCSLQTSGCKTRELVITR